jgi:UDP-N-acetylglucosamine--N-acetylmuramyl-(pentapeptide) pyrophosphoryl-undecaprenol N-acetylglucosamine transferase
MQCPAAALEPARGALAQAGIDADLQPFFEDVADRLVNAHLVIGRAGGSTVAELGVVGRPSILVPLTINADQRANAKAMASAGGAVLVEQAEGAVRLAARLAELLNDPARLAAMAEAAASAGIADAAARLAELTLAAIAQSLTQREMIG